MKAHLNIPLLFLLIIPILSNVKLPSDNTDEKSETGVISISEVKGDLFYWLCKPRSQNIQAPLIMFLNGGPGASSMSALFYENGPYNISRTPNHTIVLAKRPISWNEDAYVLYLDQPRGVGLSKAISEACTDEECVSNDMYVFLSKFYDLHPDFKYRPFYISGESYAGHYIPAITRMLYDNPIAGVELKGILIGNPWTDPYSQIGMYAYFIYIRGITSIWEYILDRSTELACQFLLTLDIRTKLNLRTCWDWAVKDPAGIYGFNLYNIKKSDSYDYSAMVEYLNQEETQKKLGVYEYRHFVDLNWDIFRSFRYDFLTSQKYNVEYLLAHGVNVLIYSGMDDYICNYMSSQVWLRRLNWEPGRYWTQIQEVDWKVDGHVKGYKKVIQNLQFIKILGAGHMVPTEQPLSAYSMLMEFIAQNS